MSDVPPVGTAIVVPAPPPKIYVPRPPPSPGLIIAAILILVLIVAVIWWFLIRDDNAALADSVVMREHNTNFTIIPARGNVLLIYDGTGTATMTIEKGKGTLGSNVTVTSYGGLVKVLGAPGVIVDAAGKSLEVQPNTSGRFENVGPNSYMRVF